MIQSDSRSWGNYGDSVGGASIKSSEKQPSATNEYWKVNNIYDLAGNIEEWTQENYSIATNMRLEEAVATSMGATVQQPVVTTMM